MIIDNFNIDIVFKITLTSFIRLEEITHPTIEAKKTLFKDIKVIRSNISFVKKD